MRSFITCVAILLLSVFLYMTTDASYQWFYNNNNFDRLDGAWFFVMLGASILVVLGFRTAIKELNAEVNNP